MAAPDAGARTGTGISVAWRRGQMRRLTQQKGQPRPRFWELPLAELNRKEWELLCDGCARCCLLKIEEEEFDAQGRPLVSFTRVSCRYLNHFSGRCTVYRRRQKKEPDCVVPTLENLPSALHWIPSTCAYKLRYQDLPLPDWHPLLTGSDEAM